MLRADMPRAARKELSLLLNKAHAAKWYVRDDTGEVVVVPPEALLDAERPSQFEALSKVLDADELGGLLRVKLRINEDLADAGYAAVLTATLPTSKL